MGHSYATAAPVVLSKQPLAPPFFIYVGKRTKKSTGVAGTTGLSKNTSNTEQLDSQPDVICIDDPTSVAAETEPVTTRSVVDIANECNNVSELLKNIHLTSDQLSALERATVGQGSNDLWKKARKGRITASVFYRVHTKMEKLKKDPSISCESLLQNLINPPPLGHLAHIAKGSESEAKAVESVMNILRKERHSNLSLTQCGLFVHPEKQYLGASPDGIITCDCCGTRLLEIKCPSRELSELEYLDQTRVLKNKHLYYGQVQGQIMVTGIKDCYFYIFTDTNSHLQLITRDTVFCAKMSSNLEMFYTHYMGPKLINH